MKKKVLSVILAAVCTMGLMAGCGAEGSKGSTQSGSKGDSYTVGISQFAEHGSLDNCREGFLEGLKEEGIEEGKNLKVDYQNAQTDTGTASTIADSFVSEKVDMICAIATPCAASAYNSAMNADIPTVYTAVSDPVVAGLAKEDGSSVGNITGSSDVLPVEEQLKMIREMMPDAKKIGILYTTSEANSCSTIEEYKELADKYDFEIVDTGINTSADIEIAASDLVSKVDCLCNLTDNTVVNALQTVLDKANGAKIPVFGSEIEQVKSGCVASMGIDYYQLGIETGKMAAKILKGEEKASDTPFITASKAELYVNTAAADKIGMTLDADYIKDGNTLSDDQFAGSTFDYILSNPPFGREWKNEKAKVEEEAKLGFGGRFGAGLPAASDGQMLFLMTAISKMKDIDKGGSRIAIIHNGSPLFTGDAGSGPSEIRRYILENDLLEAIVALPNDIFYNTGIATYIWVLSNKKAGTVREGKVQLINANEMFVKRRKALGNKRNDISEEDIAEITKIYGDFKESEISQIYDNEDFGYTKITVERPLRNEEGNLVLKKGKKQPDTSLRDTENVPLKEDIKEYFEREVLPFAPDAWIDTKKSKVGYEIPFTRYFYKYEAPRPSAEIMAEIMDLETELSGSLEEVFDL